MIKVGLVFCLGNSLQTSIYHQTWWKVYPHSCKTVTRSNGLIWVSSMRSPCWWNLERSYWFHYLGQLHMRVTMNVLCTARIGIGSKYTFHGMPDIALKGETFVIMASTSLTDDHGDESSIQPSPASGSSSGDLSSPLVRINFASQFNFFHLYICLGLVDAGTVVTPTVVTPRIYIEGKRKILTYTSWWQQP